jgi:hypothetical protein
VSFVPQFGDERLESRFHVSVRLTEDLHEEMYGFQVRQLVVVGVHADTEEETRVSPVHNLVVLELRTDGWVIAAKDAVGSRRGTPRQSWTGTSGPGAPPVCGPRLSAGPVHRK